MLPASSLRTACIGSQSGSLRSRQICKLVASAVELFLEAVATLDPEILQLPFGTIIAAVLCVIGHRHSRAGQNSATLPSSST
jgi:hypothetical protein